MEGFTQAAVAPPPSKVWRIAKHSLGVLLGAIGLFCIVGCIGVVLQNDDLETAGAWLAVFFVVGGLLPIALATALLRPHIAAVPAASCPRCGSLNQARAGVLTPRSSRFTLHLLGLPLALLLHGSKRSQVRCADCDQLHFVETRGTRIAGVCLQIVIAFLLLAGVMDSLFGK